MFKIHSHPFVTAVSFGVMLLATVSAHAQTNVPGLEATVAPSTVAMAPAPGAATVPAQSTPTSTTTAMPVSGSVPSPESMSSAVPGVAGPLPENAPIVGSKSLVGVAIPAPPPASGFDPDMQAKIQEDLQSEARADLEKKKRDEERNGRAFDRALGGVLPMEPNQIRSLMNRVEQTDDAARLPANGAVKSQVRITTLSLEPGATPPMIYLQPGYVTTINIVDSTGEPWPILDVGVGGNFEVSPTPAGSQVVRVMPLSNNAMGNLSVILKELSTPVIFRLSTEGDAVDMRYDARIPKFGPGARIPLISRPHLQAGGEDIIALLQNTPPQDARRVMISGLDARSKAWSLNGHTYVRTPLTLLSPAWDASVSSDDGMTVYEIGDAPVLLMSDNGALIRAKLMRDHDHDE